MRVKTTQEQTFADFSFGTLKCSYGLTRSRYIGLEKVVSEVNLKTIACYYL